MGLVDCVQKINKDGIKLNKAKINADLGKLSTARERATKKLYDMGYLGSLGWFSDKEIIRSLHSEYGEEVQYLYSEIDGVASLSQSRLRFCKYNTANSDLKKVVDILIEMLDCEVLYQGLKEMKPFVKDGVFYPSIVANTCGIVSKVNVLKCRDMLKYLDFGVESKVYVQNIYPTLYFEFLVSIGVDEEIIHLCKNKNKGVLFTNLTYAQELAILDLVLNYELLPNTDYRHNYLSAKRKYYVSAKSRASCKEEYTRNNYRNVEDIVTKFESCGLGIRLCTQDFIVYEKGMKYDNTMENMIYSNTRITSALQPSWCNASNYCRDYITGSIADIYLLLGGYSGEFISSKSEDYLRLQQGVSFEDFENKISFKDYNVTSKGYENMLFATIKGTDIKSRYNNNRALEYSDVDNIFSKFGAVDENSLFEKIDCEVERRYKVYNLENEISLIDAKLIIKDMVYGVLHALVGEVFKTQYHNKEVLSYIYTTDCFYKLCSFTHNILRKYKII